MSKRKRFSEKEVIATLWHQGIQLWCYRCRGTIRPRKLESGKLCFEVQREHVHEVALDGPDIPENCRYSHTKCHRIVTDGTPATSAGSSKHRIAKAKRIERTRKMLVNKHWDTSDYVVMPAKFKRKWPSRKMQSRPFPRRVA